MRFAEHLTAHLTPEWRTQYIDYEVLKDYLYKSLPGEMSEFDSEDHAQVQQEVCEKIFFQMCENELEKVNNFYAEKLAEAKRKFIRLEGELEMYVEHTSHRGNWLSSSVMSISRRRHKGSDVTDARRSSSRGGPFGGIVYQKTQAIRKEKRRVKKLHDMKLAFSEFYLSLILLQNYQTLNFTGFRKILKKHDKLFNVTTGCQWRIDKVEPALFNTNKEVDQLISTVETSYTRELEHGDRQKAMKRLRVPPLTEQQNPWTTFRVGLFFGAVFVQIVVICLTLAFVRPLPRVWEPAHRIFRSNFLITLFIMLIGINTYSWRSSGVNHVLIFEIDPRNHLTHYELLEISGFMSMLWASAVLLFLYSSLLGIQAYIAPFCLTSFLLLYLLNPLRILHYKARRWLLRTLWRIFTAPFHRVNFADFWLADQLNSLSIVFMDLAFFFCYFSTQHDWSVFMPHYKIMGPQLAKNHTEYNINHRGGACTGMMFGLAPFLKILPAWFRFAQCVRRYYDMDQKKAYPHLVNAGKYSTTFFIIFFATLSVIFNNKILTGFWILASITGTIYCYAWDILNDWGLLDKDSKDTVLLRDELVYEYKAYYYGAIIEDLILRLTWTLDIAAVRYKWPLVEILRSGLAVGEVIRRFIWNFFRLENEHLNNCGQFRAVRDIFIAPIRDTCEKHKKERKDPVEDKGDLYKVDDYLKPSPEIRVTSHQKSDSVETRLLLNRTNAHEMEVIST